MLFLPLTDCLGLQINWDSANGNTSQLKQVTQDVPKHTYTTPGEYIVQIIGETVNGQFYVQGLYDDFGKNTFLKELIYWGENDFTRIDYFGENIEGTIPEPTKNSFRNTKMLVGMFDSCHKITGQIPRYFFGNCPKLEGLYMPFYYCKLRYKYLYLFLFYKSILI